MKRGGPNHPKTFALAEALGIRRFAAVGLLEMLFHFAAQYAPEGDIGRYSDKRIAAAVDWQASPARLIEALAATGWIDTHPGVGWVVHGWSEHADRSVLQRLSRLGKKTIQSNHTDTGKVMPQCANLRIKKVHQPVPVPVPVPVPPPPKGGLSSSKSKKEKDLKRIDDEKTTTVAKDAQNCCLLSPDEELRAIFEQKTGVRISLDVERRVWETVELRGCTRAEFIERLRPHATNDWTNPAGFLTAFARRVGQVSATKIEILESAAEPERNAWGRCGECNGLGKTDTGWCSCETGRDFAAIELRAQGRKQIAAELAAAGVKEAKA